MASTRYQVRKHICRNNLDGSIDRVFLFINSRVYDKYSNVKIDWSLGLPEENLFSSWYQFIFMKIPDYKWNHVNKPNVKNVSW